jgi:hypothetical protein
MSREDVMELLYKEKAIVQIKVAEATYIYNQESRGFNFIKNESKRTDRTNCLQIFSVLKNKATAMLSYKSA